MTFISAINEVSLHGAGRLAASPPFLLPSSPLTQLAGLIRPLMRSVALPPLKINIGGGQGDKIINKTSVTTLTRQKYIISISQVQRSEDVLHIFIYYAQLKQFMFKV